MQATAPQIAVEYETGLPDRIRIYVGDRSWQIWFHNVHDLRGYLRDACKYRGLPREAAVEAVAVVEAWWAYNSDGVEQQCDRDGVARTLGLIGLCLLPWALIWEVLR